MAFDGAEAESRFISSIEEGRFGRRFGVEDENKTEAEAESAFDTCRALVAMAPIRA